MRLRTSIVAACVCAALPATAQAAAPVTISGLKWSRPAVPPGRNLVATYLASGATTLSFSIHNALDQPIRDLGDNVPTAAGQHAVDWDGYGDSTKPVPDGVYRLVLTSSDPSGITGTTSAPVEIDNHPPSIHFRSLRIKPGGRLEVVIRDALSGVVSGVLVVDGRVVARLHHKQARFTFRPRGGWSRGTHTVTVETRDRAYNLGRATRRIDVR